MPKPTIVPTWATDAGAAINEPSSGKRAAGWLVGETVPAEWLNWLQRYTGQWCAYVNGMHGEAATWTGLQTFAAGAAVPAAADFSYAPRRVYSMTVMPQALRLGGGAALLADYVHFPTPGSVDVDFNPPAGCLLTAVVPGARNMHATDTYDVTVDATKLTAAGSGTDIWAPATVLLAAYSLSLSAQDVGWFAAGFAGDEAARTMPTAGVVRCTLSVASPDVRIYGVRIDFEVGALRPAT